LARKPHKSLQQDAEQGMDALLRRSLSTSAPAAECPAPELLAAYSERSLDRDEVVSLDVHLASCARCREMLAALDRGAPQEVLQERQGGRAGWAWVWDWRWLAPAAATFALAGIWFVRHEQAAQLVRETRQLPILAMARSRELEPDVVPQDRATAPLPSAPESPATPPAQPEPAEKKSVDQQSQAAARDLAQVEQLRKEADSLDNSLKQEENDAAKSAAGAASSTALPQGSAAPSAAPLASAPKAKAALASPAAGTLARLQSLQSAPLNTIIHTPDSNVLWRLVAGGFIDRSTDGGATWQRQVLAPNGVDAADSVASASVRIAAGSAPTAKVCWLVGNAGLMLLTKDGETWTTISPPARVDFAAVSATSAQNATVTAADGRKFATRDGGATWSQAQ
jgi:hypothetical protein